MNSKAIAVIVVCAVIYTIAILVSALIPAPVPGTFGIYIPAILSPLFGIWFGIYGAIGALISSPLARILRGDSFIHGIPGGIGQFFMVFIPFLLYHKAVVRRKIEDMMHFQGVNVIAMFVGSFIVATGFWVTGVMPVDVAYKATWPWMAIGNVIQYGIFGPILLNLMTPFIMPSGLFLGSARTMNHWNRIQEEEE